ncbi:GPP34 family phosphoprotein [Bacillus cereus]|uniref:GOLPH3/VPS74 family protein n=1 Tax=Bacillus cereus TaxID=1396 RepID=UPI0018F38B4E|nr:GPP34 family phosphoprotein [Bacillus cereus]MBJ8054808.1 GPP34 family phosphoprotein [Bacillus cereus]
MLKELTIPQEFALLALDRETNKFKAMFRQHVELYTTMACLIELSLKNKVKFEEDDTVTLLETTSTGDKSLDRLLEIVKSEKPKKIKKWASYFYNHMFKQREIYKLVLETLIEKGILKVENTEILFVFPKKEYVDVDNTRHYIVEKIRAELLEENNVEFNTVVLVLFLEQKKMLEDYFSDYERKALKQKIEQLRKEETFKSIKSIDKTIKTIEASIVAVIAASATT